MEINLNHQLAATRAGAIGTRVVRAAAASDAEAASSFPGSRRLEAALAAAPDVRSEAVERARILVSSPEYPPQETMQKLARLLAIEFDQAR